MRSPLSETHEDAPGEALRIAFLHPDLGIGGAERLVVDAAQSLRNAGHRVVIFTSHHDMNRCFEETRDGTLEISVRGDFLPTHVAQRLRAPCAIARMMYLACIVAIRRRKFDIVFCDLVAQAVLPLKLFGQAHIVFYCHFPDQLMARHDRWYYRIYRWPIDRLEELATGFADRILVNSRHTALAFRQAFPRLDRLTPEVLYPAVACAASSEVQDFAGHTMSEKRETMLLCMSRYEKKKNMTLAIEALSLLRHQVARERFGRIRLTIVGGYDSRMRENRDTLSDLQQLARQRQLEKQVCFLRSCTDHERKALLCRSLFVVYTPENEHFGYVPLEAMAAGRPVIAVNNGGPTETIRHEKTGLLCPARPDAFAQAFKRFLDDPGEAERMGRAGREHVAAHFSSSRFERELKDIMLGLVGRRRG